MMALGALVTCGQECGGPSSSKDLTPGEDHLMALKEGQDPIISSFGERCFPCALVAPPALTHPLSPHSAHVTLISHLGHRCRGLGLWLQPSLSHPHCLDPNNGHK